MIPDPIIPQTPPRLEVVGVSVAYANGHLALHDTSFCLEGGTICALVGINGSGKSNLLKAIKLLFEGIAGEGFKKTFLEDWGGFSSVANYSSDTNFIKLSFEFDANKVNEIKIPNAAVPPKLDNANIPNPKNKTIAV